MTFFELVAYLIKIVAIFVAVAAFIPIVAGIICKMIEISHREDFHK